MQTLDGYLGKTEFAATRGCCRKTVNKFDRYCRIWIPDYRKETMLGMPLTNYQVWVLTIVMHLSKEVRKDILVKNIVVNRLNKLSKAEYLKGETNNGEYNQGM